MFCILSFHPLIPSTEKPNKKTTTPFKTRFLYKKTTTTFCPSTVPQMRDMRDIYQMSLKLRDIYFQPMRNEYFDHVIYFNQPQSLRDPLCLYLFFNLLILGKSSLQVETRICGSEILHFTILWTLIRIHS